MTSLNNYLKVLRDIIKEELAKGAGIKLYVVTGVNESTYTVQVKDPSRSVQYDEVPILGLGLGHIKGMMKLPAVNDWVVCGFIGKNELKPIILGSIFDQYSQSPDTIPAVVKDQLLIVGKEAGPFISLQSDGSIVIESVDTAGNPANGAKIKLATDGSFKLYNKGNFGVESDANGNITLRGVTINATQTPGVFP